MPQQPCPKHRSRAEDRVVAQESVVAVEQEASVVGLAAVEVPREVRRSRVVRHCKAVWALWDNPAAQRKDLPGKL